VLTLSNVQPGNAGGYFAVVTNLAGTATSRIASLIVSPTITTQPHNQIVAVGSNALFQVGATGLSVNYRWRHNGVPVTGGTNATFSISAAQPANAGNYSVVVANPAGAVTSIVATLSVAVPPAIVLQPRSQKVAQGSNVILSVTATGTLPFRYQWSFNTTNLAGATKSSLSLLNFQPGQQGNYTLTVSNVVGVITSDIASLSLTQPSRLTAFGGTTGAPYTIRFFGVPGSNYVLETSTDLTNWVVLKTAGVTNGMLDYVDGDSSNTPQRFFRVR